MAFRVLVILLVSLVSLSNVKCIGHRSPIDATKLTVLSEIKDDLSLSRCSTTGMGALLNESIVDFLAECDLPIPVSGVVSNDNEANAFLCMGYFDVSLKLCKYFSVDNDTKIALPKTKDKMTELLKSLDKNLSDFCPIAPTDIKSSEFHQTAEAIKPLIALLSDKNHCERVCYDFALNLKPVCKIILWANMKLSDYAESQKGHEKILKLKEGLAPKGNATVSVDTTLQVEQKTVTAQVITPAIIVDKTKLAETPLPKEPETAVKPDSHVYSQVSGNILEDTQSSVVESSIPAVETPKATPKEPVIVKIPVPVTKALPKLPMEPVDKPSQPKVTPQQKQPTSEEQIFNNMPEVYLEHTGNRAEPEDGGNNGEDFSRGDDLNNDKDLQGQLQSSNNRDPSEVYEGQDENDLIVENPPAVSSSSVGAKGRLNIATSVNQAESGYTFTGHSVDVEDSHFFPFFFLGLLFVIFGYVLFHNKHKLLGLLVEGRRGEGRRRGVGGPAYRKLDCTLEEAVNSAPPSHNPHIVY